MNNEIEKFEAGTKYFFDTICDERYHVEILERTARTVTVKFLNGRYSDVIKTYEVTTFIDSEIFLPFGKRSGKCYMLCTSKGNVLIVNYLLFNFSILEA